MSKMPLFFVVVAIIVIAASFRFVQQRRERMDNDAAPLQQKQMVVSNKREYVPGFRPSPQRQTAPAGSDVRFEVSVKPQNGGMEVTYRVDEKQYHQLSVGDKGTLSYKGSRFVEFRAE
ncbi:DUF2500 domain-containing protein [Scandinavium sp.]|uniref:DUF2500 domain-containing protein n=1 Tax=Scandinavium sp. TaxID=2830653 RepID=UPI00289F02C2|nr:DUF2500 domain-containing protein [Scandinavium sp.]